MALINSMMQQQQVAPPVAPGPAQEPAAQAQPNAAASPPGKSPKEFFKRFTKAAMRLIYDTKASGDLVNMMRAGKHDPAQVVASAALEVINRIKRDVRGINPNAVFAISMPVVVFLLELADAAKVFPVNAQLLKDSLAALAELTKRYSGSEHNAPPSGEMGPQATPMAGNAAPMGA